jgi:hypothetical protein
MGSAGLSGWRVALGEDAFYDFAVDVGEAEVAALGAEGELGVVEAEEVKDGGVEVVHVDGIFGDVEAEVVGGAVGEAFFDAAAGHPDGEGTVVVIAAVVGALRHGGAAEFAAPDDESVFEKAALLEVGDERGAGFIGFLAIAGEAAFEVAMLVPGFVKELHETDAAGSTP